MLRCIAPLTRWEKRSLNQLLHRDRRKRSQLPILAHRAMNCIAVEGDGELAVERPAFGWIAFSPSWAGAVPPRGGIAEECGYEIGIEIGLFRSFPDLVDFVRHRPEKEADKFIGYTSRRGLGFLRWVLQQLPSLEQEVFASLDDRTGTEVQCYILVASGLDDRRHKAYRWLLRLGFELDEWGDYVKVVERQ